MRRESEIGARIANVELEPERIQATTALEFLDAIRGQVDEDGITIEPFDISIDEIDPTLIKFFPDGIAIIEPYEEYEDFAKGRKNTYSVGAQIVMNGIVILMDFTRNQKVAAYDKYFEIE